ncbi:Macrophage erythroblast attacher protein-like protein [Venustampulla echinocandica]|uniref:Macrophage erythroblast attacher protein-like protein n=1 Tax=Venustampulla echinocandica TaxID=2656787 RepID=A0A370TV07_9HELO|nr:Macrophage erythroblast attacher protein-like protein [Venustampulla echinocandica]RDL39373.1 Macrophage erythroblast attacher protein-like protein [Venustampulla echinocandica]
MADHVTSKLNPDTHLLLDQPLLRLPFELLRKNFKVAHFNVEKESTAVKSALRDTANASLTAHSSPEEVLKNVDSMLARMRGLKRKLNACSEEEARLQKQSQSRVRHLGELYGMQSLDDVKYEEWSRTRLGRLLIDYLLRNGYKESAHALAKEKGIEDLVDVETFVQMSRIRDSLQKGRVTEALAWCSENKKELRRMEASPLDLYSIFDQRSRSNFEFMLRFQQYIELVRTQDQTKLLESINHAKKHLIPFKDSYPKEVQQACGLLAFPPSTRAEAYSELYNPQRWTMLANLFMQTHNSLLSLPSVPLLHIALSAGLSALKTPSCHSSHISAISPTSSSSITTSVCPICSTELNDLARNVPYAHHTKSHVESDLVLLPNGCVYGARRLEEYSRKAGLGPGLLKDLRNGDVFSVDDVKKVYIS